MISEKKRTLVTASERNGIDREMMVWANKFPDIPDGIMLINYEYFASKTVGLGLSTAQGAYITKRYIYGGHIAEYNFEVHYQITPSGANNDARLKAVELLNYFGEWAEENWPELGEGRQVLELRTTSGASYLGATSDYYEDYMIPLKLTYEVMN